MENKEDLSDITWTKKDIPEEVFLSLAQKMASYSSSKPSPFLTPYQPTDEKIAKIIEYFLLKLELQKNNTPYILTKNKLYSCCHDTLKQPIYTRPEAFGEKAAIEFRSIIPIGTMLSLNLFDNPDILENFKSAINTVLEKDNQWQTKLTEFNKPYTFNPSLSVDMYRRKSTGSIDKIEAASIKKQASVKQITQPSKESPKQIEIKNNLIRLLEHKANELNKGACFLKSSPEKANAVYELIKELRKPIDLYNTIQSHLEYDETQQTPTLNENRSKLCFLKSKETETVKLLLKAMSDYDQSRHDELDFYASAPDP